MVTCESAEAQTLFPLTSSAEGSRVSRTVSLASVKPRVMSGTCGESSPALFAKCGPDGCWQRTYQDCSPLSLDGSSVEFCGTWPRSGTMSNGKAYRRALWVRHIHGNECTLWLTPTVFDSHLRPGTAPNNTLSFMVRFQTDWRRRNGSQTPCQIAPEHLNPNFVEWLMGFPLGWTDLDA